MERFEELGLPGAEIIDSGLRHLARGELDEVDALIVAELRPRLQFLGIPIPEAACAIPNPRERLFRIMESRHGDFAHERFSAALKRADSFCDALSSLQPWRWAATAWPDPDCCE